MVPDDYFETMLTEGKNDSTEAAYEELERRIRRCSNLDAAARALSWDLRVVMPDAGTPARAEQLSTLTGIHHEELTDEEFGRLLETVEAGELEDGKSAVVREARRQYDRRTDVPRDLIERIAETASSAHPVWKRAKAEDDFDSFAPMLESLLELKREYASYVDPDVEPYAVLFADYEPFLDLETAERILSELRTELPPLIDAIQDSDVELADAFTGSFDVDTQEKLSRAVLDALGYDWSRGRLDRAPHPFASGTPFDARVTTRFDESDMLCPIMSTIHEFGHANYTLGLPRDQYGTPLGQAQGLTVHESQSRLWENHVGRSEAFWEFFLPTATKHFPQLESVSPREAYESANRVYDDNLIRTEADELTYHLHIVVRYELERALLEGDLAVADIPAAWNDSYETYLGVRPDSDTEGCLQDTHWSHGSFGYFPTYTLGSVLAAQLWAAAEAAIPDLDDAIRSGTFDPLSDWLREQVHRHGKRYTTPELIERVTGEPLTARYFLSYIRSKYRPLYGIE